jgi:hypothetical protein
MHPQGCFLFFKKPSSISQKSQHDERRIFMMTVILTLLKRERGLAYEKQDIVYGA